MLVNNPTSNSSFQGSFLQGILMNAFFLALRMTSILEVVKCIWNWANDVQLKAVLRFSFLGDCNYKGGPRHQ